MPIQFQWRWTNGNTKTEHRKTEIQNRKIGNGKLKIENLNTNIEIRNWSPISENWYPKILNYHTKSKSENPNPRSENWYPPTDIEFQNPKTEHHNLTIEKWYPKTHNWSMLQTPRQLYRAICDHGWVEQRMDQQWNVSFKFSLRDSAREFSYLCGIDRRFGRAYNADFWGANNEYCHMSSANTRFVYMNIWNRSDKTVCENLDSFYDWLHNERGTHDCSCTLKTLHIGRFCSFKASQNFGSALHFGRFCSWKPAKFSDQRYIFGRKVGTCVALCSILFVKSNNFPGERYVRISSEIGTM